MYNISEKDANYALRLLTGGDKVAAIKYIRKITGAGLKETKYAIECEFSTGPIRIGMPSDQLVKEYMELIKAQTKVFETMLALIEEKEE